ncbi:MAG: SpoIIE family protein phosphatase [Bacteroidales bacterium]|nr:SpoIIE family protein phosphatase [Bacteroidales bacterium]
MRKIYIILLIITQQFILFGQENIDKGAPFIRNFTEEEYDASSQIWDIIQDNRGVMYFGNIHGVIEYDGKSWRIIETSNNSVVLSFAKNKQGTIFIGASGEFGYLGVKKDGELTYVSLKQKLAEQYRDFNDINKVFVTSHGVYYLTENNIFKYCKDTVVVVPSDLPYFYGFKEYDEIFIVNSKKGIYVLKNDKLRFLPHSDKIIVKNGYYEILSYLKNKLLIITEKKGSFIYDMEMISPKDFSGTKSNFDTKYSLVIKKFPTQIDKYIEYNKIYSSARINDTIYALGTVEGGIVLMDIKGRLVSVINKNRGLLDNTIISLYVDVNKNLWAGMDNGIAMIEISCPVTVYNKFHGLDKKVLNTINFQSTQYVGTDKGVYYLSDYIMNPKNDNYKCLKVENSNSFCWDFISFNETLLTTGINSINEIKNHSAIEFDDFEFIYCFGQSKKFPDIIFLGLMDGLGYIKKKYKNNEKNDEIKLIDYNKFEEIKNPIRELTSDMNGDIWLTTEFHGVIYIKFNNNDLSDYQIHQYDTANGLPRLDYNFVSFVDNKLIASTQKGVYKYLYTTNDSTIDTNIKFVPDTYYNKIISKKPIGVSQFEKTYDDDILINSENGILILNKMQDGSYIVNDVLFKKIPSAYSVYSDKNEIIWICTNGGLYRVDSKIKKNYNIPYYTIIRDVKIGNDSTIFKGTYYNDSISIDNISLFAELEQPKQMCNQFDYENNSITFTYSTTFYESEDSLFFSYKLEGFNDKWSAWSEQTKKEYTNLSEGDYEFYVKAKNIFNVKSKPAKYSFAILPPWHRTIFAYIAYFIIFALIFYLAIMLNIKRLKAANQRLEEIVKQRTAEIEKQKKELEKLSIVASETDNAVIIMDAKGNFEWVNEGFTRMYGYTLNEFIKKIGRNIKDVSPNIYITEMIDSCILNKESMNYESLTVSKSGNKIWTQTTLTPILDENKNVIKLVAIDTNIERLKTAEEEISQQKEELQSQSELLEESNTELERTNLFITDSISYAKLIQEAMLPSKNILKEYFPEYFIFYQPRYIVSGDFYWFSHQDNKTFIASVDCTGHGVPGAFMSMIGNTLLNEIVNEKKIFAPDKILEKLNTGVINSLNQEGENKQVQDDGMDISLCCIDKKNKTIEFACANQTIYMFQDKKMIIIEGDIYSIGGVLAKKHEIKFKKHTYELKKDTCFYLFSDGYQDQFGGKENKKFMRSRFEELLVNSQNYNMNQQYQIIKSTFDVWKGFNKQIDDILVIGIKIDKV